MPFQSPDFRPAANSPQHYVAGLIFVIGQCLAVRRKRNAERALESIVGGQMRNLLTRWHTPTMNSRDKIDESEQLAIGRKYYAGGSEPEVGGQNHGLPSSEIPKSKWAFLLVGLGASGQPAVIR